jgi:adenine-specific DNA-methyltransferase
MSIEKLGATTPDITRQNVARIAELFPECVTEGPLGTASDKGGPVIDFDLLRQALSDHAVDGPQERYRLDWPGKRAALLTANTPIDKTLRPMREDSVNFDTTRNLFIEGDNLDALKLLQETYLGKVKMIYIDPPYNTGKDFIYRDNFAKGLAEYEATSGQRDDAGGRLVANPETNGRFHSDWLSMMYPRLKLARNLLRNDGAIFISCDEGELSNLRATANQVFGEGNFIAELVWAAGKKNDSRLISVSHEYMVCYARDAGYLAAEGTTWRQKKKGLDTIYAQFRKLTREFGTDYSGASKALKSWYAALADGDPAKLHRYYSSVDARGIYFPDNISWPGGGGPKFEVKHPITGRAVKVPSRGWMTSDPKKMQAWIDDDRVHFGVDETKVPCIKAYLTDREDDTPYSVFYQDGRAASKRLRDLMDGDFFDFPKDETVLQQLIEMLTSHDELIVDFFAGSATTAHAAFAQNSLDGGQRAVILVQLPEGIPVDPDAAQSGYSNIAQLSRDRVRRAGAKILAEKPELKGKLDVGFRAVRIDSGNFHDVRVNPVEARQEALSGMVSHIKDDRSDEDLLFGALLQWGVDITLPVERRELLGRTVWVVDPPAAGETGAALIACFARPRDGKGGIDTDFADAIAAFAPLRVLFRDDGFASDAAKENVASRMKQKSLGTTVRVL